MEFILGVLVFNCFFLINYIYVDSIKKLIGIFFNNNIYCIYVIVFSGFFWIDVVMWVRLILLFIVNMEGMECLLVIVIVRWW